MPRFYINLPLQPGETIELPIDVVRHILVLRHKINDEIVLFNGDGNGYSSQIVEISRKSVIAKITSQISNKQKSSLNINLLLCIIANDKMDLAIQKAVETGVSEITPVISERSQKLHTDKIAKRMEHWQKIIISSCEQCGNNIIPKLNLPIRFDEIIPIDGINLILSTSPNKAIELNTQSQQIQLLVGPEGGFAQKEQIDGFMPLMLGELIFRSETAVIAGLCYIQLKYGNWQ